MARNTESPTRTPDIVTSDLSGGEVDADMLTGGVAIAEFLGESLPATYRMLDARELPAFKRRNKWRMRRTAYYRHLEHLEAEAVS